MKKETNHILLTNVIQRVMINLLRKVLKIETSIKMLADIKISKLEFDDG